MRSEELMSVGTERARSEDEESGGMRREASGRSPEKVPFSDWLSDFVRNSAFGATLESFR